MLTHSGRYHARGTFAKNRRRNQSQHLYRYAKATQRNRNEAKNCGKSAESYRPACIGPGRYCLPQREYQDDAGGDRRADQQEECEQ